MRRMYSQKQLEKVVDNVIEEKDITPVSGTSDGTNWTSLTVGDETHGFASGGGEGLKTVDLSSYGWSPSGEATLSQADYDALANANCVITAGISRTDTQIAYRVHTDDDTYAFTSLSAHVAQTQAGIVTQFIKIYVDSFKKLWTLNYEFCSSSIVGTNDGTNWTSLRIGNTTKAIPTGVAPANAVTLTTDQTISGAKTFKDPNQTYAGSIKLGSNEDYGSIKLEGNPIYNANLCIVLGDADSITGAQGQYNLHKSYFYFIPKSGKSEADLGTNSFKWKNLYLSGNISNGAKSASVADIVNLIEYAKSQGWIS